MKVVQNSLSSLQIRGQRPLYTGKDWETVQFFHDGYPIVVLFTEVVALLYFLLRFHKHYYNPTPVTSFLI